MSGLFEVAKQHKDISKNSKDLPLATMGIDPGASGALAVLTYDHSQLIVCDYKGVRPIMDFLLNNVVGKFQIKGAILEKMQSHLRTSKGTCIKMGIRQGEYMGILGALSALDYPIPYEITRPQEWQKGLIHKMDGVNKPALNYCRNRFPEFYNLFKYESNDDRADATVMAIHAQRVFKK